MEIRIILAFTWFAVGFCLVTGAVLGLFKPGYIQQLIVGEIDGIKVTQNVLSGNVLTMMMPAFMAILSLTLAHPAIRWVNLIVCGVYIALILMTYAYYLTEGVPVWIYTHVLKILELTLYVLIIRYSWNWIG